ncbi:TetR/AcrR family transcriptional regulator [Geodermatophilus sp. SYSU D00691]
MTAANKRPAHRPSRRTTVVRSAMELFASPRSDAITVAEIADAAGMTSAAVYYHFASKDDILLEGLRAFGDAMVTEARRDQQEVAADGASIGELHVRLLGWMDERRDEATVWFVKSSGVSLAVEQLRRELRHELMTVFSRAAKAARPKTGAAEAAVIATALLSLLETAATSWLTDDESVTGLGRQKFLDETCRLAERITGV